MKENLTGEDRELADDRLLEELKRRLEAARCPGCRECIESALHDLDGDTADECIERMRWDTFHDIDTETLLGIKGDSRTCERCRGYVGEALEDRCCDD